MSTLLCNLIWDTLLVDATKDGHALGRAEPEDLRWVADKSEDRGQVPLQSNFS